MGMAPQSQAHCGQHPASVLIIDVECSGGVGRRYFLSS